MARSDGTLRVFGAEQCRWGTENTWCGIEGRNTATWTYFSQQSSGFLKISNSRIKPFSTCVKKNLCLKTKVFQGVSLELILFRWGLQKPQVEPSVDTNGSPLTQVKKSDGMIMRSARRLFRQISPLDVRQVRRSGPHISALEEK